MYGWYVYFKPKWERLERDVPFYHVNYRPRIFVVAIFWFISVSLLLIVANSTVGILEWITNPRQGYESSRVGYGLFYNSAVSLLCIGYGLLFFANLSFASKVTWYALYGAAFYQLGSKMHILNAIFFYISALYYGTGKVVSLKTLSIALIGSLGLLGTFLASYSETGIYGDINNTLLLYFNYYQNAAIYFDEFLRGTIELYFGEIYFTDFWRAIPRAIFPGKPELMGVTLINNDLGIGDPKLGWTPAIGAGVEYFADFGLVSSFLFPLFSLKNCLSGLAFSLLSRHKYNPRRMSIFFIFVFIAFCNQSYNMFFVFPANIVASLFFYYIYSFIFIIESRLVTTPLSNITSMTKPSQAVRVKPN
jgi:hypothetical protein